jgi:hypothetical protein
MNARRQMAVMVAVGALVVVLLEVLLVRSNGPLAGAAGTAVAGASAGLHSFGLTAPSNGSCAYSGPLGGLNAPESVVVLVVIAAAGIGAGIAIGRLGTPSGGGAGKVKAEPPDPCLNPQPLPPGFRPPEPEPALNPQPLPPGFKPPEAPPGSDRPT